MPAPKKPRKSKAAPPKNQYTADLSSSQMVLGMTIVMVFGLACFLLGVLIGKFDPSLKPVERIAHDTPPIVNTTEVSSTTSKPSEPVQSPEKPKATTQPPIETKRIIVALTPATKPVQPSTQIPESATATISTPTLNEPKALTIPAGTAQSTVSTPKVTTVDTPKVENVKIQSPAVPAQPKKDVFAVQIAAFKDPTMAERERKRLEAKLPFKIDILKRRDDVYSRLLIGHYATKPEAIVLKEQLIKQYKLVEPYPVRRN
jgi:hypothetical protein